jgi:hypothetical protein
MLTFGGHLLHPWSTANDEEGVVVRVVSSSSRKLQRRELLKRTREALGRANLPWLSIQGDRWLIDADALKLAVPVLAKHRWLVGYVLIQPEQETVEHTAFGTPHFDETAVAYMTPASIGDITMPIPPGCPPEITESIGRFRKDHPDPKHVGFVMMRFASTGAHKSIIEAIRQTLDPLGFSAVRADDKQYHDDLFPNILTYIYGCAFGVAVFERLESDDFNPNVSLEVGYLLALRKPVCLLKDKTLKTLPTDLVGKLYRQFDPQNPGPDIATNLNAWMQDKGLV